MKYCDPDHGSTIASNRSIYGDAVIAFACLLLCSIQAYGAGVKLAWDASSESNLSGYKVYYRTVGGSYTTPIILGLQTTCTVPISASGTYYFAVTAYTSSAESEFSNEVSTTLSDTTAPTLLIVSPSSNQSVSSSSNTLSISGTATDDFGVMQVTWTSDRGGSGTASGTSNWSVSTIALLEGTNVITVTAKDLAGNAGTATVSVTYAPPLSTSTSVISAANPSVVGAALSISATVSCSNPVAGIPTGSVIFRDETATLGVAGLDAQGQAVWSTNILPAGVHSITAEYQGAGFFLPSTGSFSQTVVVQAAKVYQTFLPAIIIK
jgi:Bacterial Ig-like domain (group 3)/Glucodextranase, domain B